MPELQDRPTSQSGGKDGQVSDAMQSDDSKDDDEDDDKNSDV